MTDKLNTLTENNFTITECDCEKCQIMCHAPCCGTPNDILNLIEAGYAKRLCLDDWAGQPPDIHPALKGYEGNSAPWETKSEEGCTFWKGGKCELHESGLKPLLGKYAHHSYDESHYNEIEEYVLNSWDTDFGREVIELWKEKVGFIDG